LHAKTGVNMAKITMEMIKELREKTQVGMMDCKKALILAEGDIEKAIDILRKKGASVAAKRAEQATNNGTIASYISEKFNVGALLEIGCETDFAANTADMQEFAKTTCEHLANTAQCCKDRCEAECLVEQKLFNNPNKTVKMLLDELMAKITENIKLSRCAKFSTDDNGLVNVYIHPGSTLGTMIELETRGTTSHGGTTSHAGLTDENRSKVAQLAKDLCMQIAVTSPLCIEPSQLDPKILEKEQCIIKEQLKASGKPEQMIEKIMIGKTNKYYEEVCLIKQKYIKQDKITVEKHVQNIGQETGCSISIKRFERFAIGS
jgi:elongation factor Ts